MLYDLILHVDCTVHGLPNFSHSINSGKGDPSKAIKANPEIKITDSATGECFGSHRNLTMACFWQKCLLFSPFLGN